jgi:cell division protein FtsW (lipid II flippase)
MNAKARIALKIAAVVLIAMCVAVLFSVNKYGGSIVLTAAAIVILLPSGKSKWLKWGRIAFLVLAFTFIIWNISTTELPKGHIETGFWFFDKVVHLLNGFLKVVFGIGPYQGTKIFFDTIQ